MPWRRPLSAERLALGTVQFGLDYGVANSRGRVEADEVAAILDLARTAGIDTLDTAVGYGGSERTLGEAGVAGFNILTKLPELPEATTDVIGWVLTEATASIERLGRQRLHGLLLHRPLDLVGPRGQELRAGLVAARETGLTDRIGVSVYSPEDLDRVWNDDLDLVQAPSNALDRRLASSGWLDRLADAGAEVHTRSAFLQGLLLMDERPAYFDRWADVLGSWDRWVESNECSPVEAALGAALADDRIDRVVIGVDGRDQLGEILDALGAPLPVPPDTLGSEDLDLIDPSRWSL